ncbi:MAG TPA: hypothetical protein VN285_05750 [Candidatus Deferrimicrobium sp.]|nr:hypothetical protein [Candidatus Deferrimicrobium sp.]
MRNPTTTFGEDVGILVPQQRDTEPDLRSFWDALKAYAHYDNAIDDLAALSILVG